MKPLRYLVRWPLRYFLPVALLCIALGVSVIQYEVELRMRQAAVQQQMQETLQHDLYRLKSSLEYLLLRGDLDRARYEVAELGALPGIIEAWLIDRNDRIIAASRIARIGQHQPRPAIPTPRSGLPWVVAENGRLQGYQLLTIQRDPTSLRPDRDGLLYISLDLTPVFAEAKAQVRREALQFGGFALVLALLLGWYFTFAVSRRLQRMEQAAQQIAQGDFHLRLGLEGDDELAHLGQSFDHMTERLQMIWEEHGRQQQALAEANAELRGLQQALDAHATVSITNPAGTIVYVNDHFCQVTGYTREELLGQNHRLLKSGAHPPEFYRDMWETITRGEIWQGVVENRNKNGNHYWVQTTIVPLHDATGTIRKFISVRTDITNQKKVENALKIASQYARSLIEASLDPMIAIGSVGKITDVNHATETVTGLPRSQLIGSDFSSYFTEPDKAQAGYHQAVQQGAVVGVPLSIRHTSGKVIEVLYNASLYYDAEGNMAGVLVVMRDITDLKQLQAEQERLRTQLQQAQKMEAIGQLTGGIAHDFNNILAAILGYTGLALERCVPDKESKLASYLQEVQTAAERARDLIAKMLAFSRGIKGTSVALDAAPLVKECVKMLRSMIPSTIALDTRIDAKLPPIQSDPVQLHQILVNLAINARDAIESSGRIEFVLSHPGQVRETCDSCHHAFDGDYVELAVQDTGCGIAPEIMQRIFDPFFTTKEVGKGSGMGLPMVHGIMHEHGGHIRVHSTPGQGTTFRLLFPVATVPEREAAETAAPAPAPAVTVSGRIVVVDDEPAVGRMLAEVLQTHGHHPTFYPDAGSALATLAAEPHSCDLVITDQTMPGTTGVELAQKLHALRPDLPVFLCTGYSDQMDAQSALRSGITRIFQKPVDSQVLLRAIQETLASLKADAS